MIRFVSRLSHRGSGKVVNLVAVPEGKEDWLGMGVKPGPAETAVGVEVVQGAE